MARLGGGGGSDLRNSPIKDYVLNMLRELIRPVSWHYLGLCSRGGQQTPEASDVKTEALLPRLLGILSKTG